MEGGTRCQLAGACVPTHWAALHDPQPQRQPDWVDAVWRTAPCRPHRLWHTWRVNRSGMMKTWRTLHGRDAQASMAQAWPSGHTPRRGAGGSPATCDDVLRRLPEDGGGYALRPSFLRCVTWKAAVKPAVAGTDQ
jgi:hypothetical protein